MSSTHDRTAGGLPADASVQPATAPPRDHGRRPVTVLTQPTPVRARSAIAAVALGTAVPADQVADLQLAASEVVANALRHGQAPVEVRCWRDGDRLTVVVRDRGAGPHDPAPPSVAPPGAEAGRGRWLAQQLVEVTERRSAQGFEVRLVTRPAVR